MESALGVARDSGVGQLVEQGMSSPSAMSLVYPVMRGDGQTPGASFVISVNRGLSREDPPKLILTADWLPGESIAFEVTGAGVDLRDLADQVAEFVRTMYGQMLHAFDELRASADRVGLTEAPV